MTQGKLYDQRTWLKSSTFEVNILNMINFKQHISNAILSLLHYHSIQHI